MSPAKSLDAARRRWFIWVVASMVLGSVLLLSLAAQSAVLECRHLPGVIASFEQRHYAVHELTQEIKQRSIEQFIRSLDPSKTLLLEADVPRMRKDLAELFESMAKGDCGVLEDTFRVIIQRAKEDERFTQTTLSDRFKLDETVELILDPEKRGYAKTPEERLGLVQKMIHFQISNFLLSGISLDAAKKQLIHRYELVRKKLQDQAERGAPLELYAEAFARALDPHSTFMSQETLADFQIQMQLSLEGIGAALRSEDGFTIIESLVPGGQAERVNALRPQDKIIAVAQEREKPVSTIDMDIKDVVRMIRGKKGTKVTLTILRESSTPKTFDVTIVRDKIDVKEQAAKISYETRQAGDRRLKIGVIDLPSFYGSAGEASGRSSSADVKALLDQALREKVDGIVIDLSRNGGGVLSEAVQISGFFLEKGAIVATRDTASGVEILTDDDGEIAYSGPLLVLISPASASAAEILAGALKDYRRALVVGSEHTFGKGTVQVLSPLPQDLGAIKVTTGMFFLPSGRSTQQQGVSADIQVPSLLDGYDIGEKTLDYSLPPQSTSPFVSKEANSSEGSKRWRPIDASTVGFLAERSRARVSRDPKMQEIRKQLAERSEEKPVLRLSEIRKKVKAAGPDKDPKARLKDLESAFVDEGANILADLIHPQ